MRGRCDIDRLVGLLGSVRYRTQRNALYYCEIRPKSDGFGVLLMAASHRAAFYPSVKEIPIKFYFLIYRAFLTAFVLERDQC